MEPRRAKSAAEPERDDSPCVWESDCSGVPVRDAFCEAYAGDGECRSTDEPFAIETAVGTAAGATGAGGGAEEGVRPRPGGGGGACPFMSANTGNWTATHIDLRSLFDRTRTR